MEGIEPNQTRERGEVVVEEAYTQAHKDGGSLSESLCDKWYVCVLKASLSS